MIAEVAAGPERLVLLRVPGLELELVPVLAPGPAHELELGLVPGLELGDLAAVALAVVFAGIIAAKTVVKFAEALIVGVATVKSRTQEPHRLAET